jgi:acyl carrier protein
MNKDEIKSKVNTVIQDVLRVKSEVIKPESRLKEDLGAESLDMVTLLMALEDTFKNSISDEDAAELTTVESIVSYISHRAEAN